MLLCAGELEGPAEPIPEALARRKLERSGVTSVLSSGFNVHGLMYTLNNRAFSSGEMFAFGILV